MTDKELMILNKLEYLKEIKVRMHEMDKLRCKLTEEMDLIGVEERCLSEYRREMDSLYQEKMTHVEELRQIHSDINMLENVLKQSEEDRTRHVDNIKLIQGQMQPLRDAVDKMRTEIGLPRLSDKEQEQMLMMDAGTMVDKFGLESQAQDSANTGKRSYKTDPSSTDSSTVQATPTKPNKPFNDNTNLSASAASSQSNNNNNNPNPVASSFSSLASLMSGFQDSRSLTGSSAAAAAAAAAAHHQTSSAYSRMLMNAGGAAGPTGHSRDSSASAPGSGPNFHHQESPAVSAVSSPAAFRQQPPPMKSCLSCHQQIHRNAPICPLCKAKSRSRHPKRRNNPKN